MNSVSLVGFKLIIRRLLDAHYTLIDKKAVMKDIYLELELSAGYFLMLSLANLIALSGLLLNSTAVIIGAMLISPLMGPMLSFGFSFVTGDKSIWKKSLIKLLASVLVTILLAAIATYLSPLDEVTNEITTRTTPNLYDLIIAFLAGMAGAAAICTKKNYLTVVPGVAIATAVIPPLSVTGFGLGTGNLLIALGGFFLFFTNFVAIVITSCIVFYFYGFRPIVTSEMDKDQLKKRIFFLVFILFTISIPLIYTLGKTISEVKMKKNIQKELKEIYDINSVSRLSTFTYSIKDNSTIEVNAVVDTVNYITDMDVSLAESKLTGYFHRKVVLNLDQVKVLRGGLKKEVLPIVPKIAPPRQPRDIIKNSREDLLAALKPSLDKIETMISPSKVVDCSVGFSYKDREISILLKINRDTPLPDEQAFWLRKILTSDLKNPVDLSIETVPFIPLLIFKKGETFLSDEMKQNLSILKEVFSNDSNIKIVIESGAESSLPYRQRILLAGQRASILASVLAADFNIPSSDIKIRIMQKAVKTPFAKIMICTNGEKSNM